MARRRAFRCLAWRIDQDYRSKLSPTERAFLDKFNAEYYGAELDAEPLHKREERSELRRQRDVAERDLVTATPAQTERAQSPAQRFGRRPDRYYSPHAYDDKPTQAAPEDVIATLEDMRQRRRRGKARKACAHRPRAA